MKKIILFFKKNKEWIILFVLFFLHLFLRFYNLEVKNIFAWDQTNNAWAALDIIVRHKYPLLGMVAKQDSGFYIGPLYYYFIALFYFFTNLDPIASGIAAGFVSIITFWGLFYFIKKIFSFNVALFATFINTIASTSIAFDRTQWPVELLPLVSLMILYFLNKIISGKPKYMILLAIMVGLSFNLHFTAIFFLLFIILCLPFFPRNKDTIKYVFISIPLFLIWLLPNFIAEIQAKNIHTNNLLNYLDSYYHGFHLRRFFQLAPDAFIQFEKFLIPSVQILKYMLIPLFFLVYFKKNGIKSIRFFLLVSLWFLIPWVVLSTYKGEISDYYFIVSRYISIGILAYLINFLFEIKNMIIKILIFFIISIYAYSNLLNFFSDNGDGGIKQKREIVDKAIKEGRSIDFQEGVPESYIYYVYTLKNK